MRGTADRTRNEGGDLTNDKVGGMTLPALSWQAPDHTADGKMPAMCRPPG